MDSYNRDGHKGNIALIYSHNTVTSEYFASDLLVFFIQILTTMTSAYERITHETSPRWFQAESTAEVERDCLVGD